MEVRLWTLPRCVGMIAFPSLTFFTSAPTGNCIWYDEPALWEEIEGLFRENGVVASKLAYPALILPPQIQQIVENRGYGNLAEGDECDAETMKSLVCLQDQVMRLQALEDELQVDYWNLRSGGVTAT